MSLNLSSKFKDNPAICQCWRTQSWFHGSQEQASIRYQAYRNRSFGLYHLIRFHQLPFTASAEEEHTPHPSTYRSQEGYIHPPANQEACPTYRRSEFPAASSWWAIFCIPDTNCRTHIKRPKSNRQNVEGIRHRHHPFCREKERGILSVYR